jgi:uncharacterized protein YjbI with pentapeptide repeats
LRGADFTRVSLFNADLTGAVLIGTNLTSGLLDSANLINVTWSNTTCPNGIVNPGPAPC